MTKKILWLFSNKQDNNEEMEEYEAFLDMKVNLLS